MKCPTCKVENDCLKFVFAEHLINGKVKTENPSDFDQVFICPGLHVFDINGAELKQQD